MKKLMKKIWNWLVYRPVSIVKFSYRTQVYIELDDTIEYLDTDTFTKYLNAVTHVDMWLEYLRYGNIKVTAKIISIVDGKAVHVLVKYPNGLLDSFDPNKEPQSALNARLNGIRKEALKLQLTN